MHALFENARENDEEHAGRETSGKDIGGRFCVENCLNAEKHRQDQNAAEEYDEFSHHGQDDGILRLAEGGESVDESVLEGEGTGSDHEYADAPDTIFDDVGRICEQGHERIRGKEGNERHKGGKDQTHTDDVFFRAPYDFFVFSAVIITDDRL